MLSASRVAICKFIFSLSVCVGKCIIQTMRDDKFKRQDANSKTKKLRKEMNRCNVCKQSDIACKQRRAS